MKMVFLFLYFKLIHRVLGYSTLFSSLIRNPVKNKVIPLIIKEVIKARMESIVAVKDRMHEACERLEHKGKCV